MSEVSSEAPRELDEKKRMWQLTFAIWVSFMNSAIYSVTSYTSPLLRAAPYNFTQSQLALVSSIAGVFVSFGLPTGMVFDRYGSAVCLRVGAVLVFLGYTIYAMMFHGWIPITVTSLILVSFPCNQWVNYFETGSFVTNLSFFARDKGTVILVEESFGSAILASWYVGFLGKDAKLLLIFIPVVGPLVVLVASFFIAAPKIDEERIPWHGHGRFIVAYIIVASSLLFYTTIDIVGNFVDFSATTQLVFAIIATCLVLSYVLIPLTLNGRGYKEPHNNISFVTLNVLGDDPTLDVAPSTHDGQLDGPGAIISATTDDDSSSRRRRGEHQEDLINERQSLLGDRRREDEDVEASTTPPGSPTSFLASTKYLFKVLRTPEIWLIIVISLVQWGVNGMIGNNMPQIYQALNSGEVDQTAIALVVSLGSVSGSIGRATAALLDRKLRNKSLLFLITMPCLGIGALLVALLPVKGFVFAISITNFGGFMNSASRALVLKQLFNGPNFGLIYNLLITAYIPVPFMFNLGLFASLYDRETIRLTGNVHGICPERSCIAPQMYIGAGVAAFGTLAALILWRRTKQRLQDK